MSGIPPNGSSALSRPILLDRPPAWIAIVIMSRFYPGDIIRKLRRVGYLKRGDRIVGSIRARSAKIDCNLMERT